MNLGSSYKILKYKAKLSKAIENNNVSNINKYYLHLKSHTVKSLKGGDIDAEQIKYDFRKLDELLKLSNIKEFAKSSLIEYKKFIIGDVLGEEENFKLLEEYGNKYLTPSIIEYKNKLSSKLDKLIKIGCVITREKNSGYVKVNDDNIYTLQCFWITTIDFLKMRGETIDIEQIRSEAELASTPKDSDTNFEEGKYLIGAAKIAEKYDLTYVIYNTDTTNNTIIESPYKDGKTEMMIIGSGKYIVIVSNQYNSHFELITSIKCDADADAVINTRDLIWFNSNVISTSAISQAKEKIGKTVKKNVKKIQKYFLNTVCSNSSECIAFGKEIKIIKDFFGNFTKFNYMKEFKQIGSDSSNGFVKMITYEKEGYVANTILKSSKNYMSDNLYYEYLVGKFLNAQSMFFPCFVETYQIFMYKDDYSYSHIEHCKTVADCDIIVLKNGLEVYSNTDIVKGLEDSCIRPEHIALLIQSLENPLSIEKLMDDVDLANKHLLYILFQIYMPLSLMADKFTHNDLHWNNVMLQEPKAGEVIKYCYHLSSTEIVEFYSPYIAKIIDYGRCYFNDGTIDSVKIYDDVCKINQCGQIGNPKTKCGKYNGYHYIEPGEIGYDLNTSQNNKSRDLWLIAIVLNRINQASNLTPLKNLLEYDGANKISDGIKIKNVHDALRELKKLIMTNENKNDNYATYGTKNLIGELHIYADGTQIEFKENK